MTRELGLNPDKFGKLDNHRQEPWKAPLPQFIEEIYFKSFKREEPLVVKPVAELIAEKKKQQEKRKKERKKELAVKKRMEAGIENDNDSANGE